MRIALMTLASLTLLTTSPVYASASQDAAIDKNKTRVIDTRGNCVRTQWQDANDPCAPPPAPAPIARPAPTPPIPQVSREALTVYFDFNSAALTAEASGKLDRIAEIVNGSTAITGVLIHGFTDQLGTDGYNAALATKRVEAVKAYLDGKSRLTAQGGDIRGLGKSSPEAGCEELKRDAKIVCMAKERRVEIEFNAEK
jgi:OOP family OmpA-OmpF porin